MKIFIRQKSCSKGDWVEIQLEKLIKTIPIAAAHQSDREGKRVRERERAQHTVYPLHPPPHTVIPQDRRHDPRE